ncbi:MAG: SPOR domain-containing protein [Acidobacteriaceae bacterium]|nr:SPOR domain-containing protein [Acidobacteriaceae bacterium]MBV9780558.1 SPOR domain-containing protein [Acidobacteriaceae bacterium]
MLRTDENETEILLGNKQLLGIFFVVAILLGVAFTGGYMVGRESLDKRTAAAETTAAQAKNAAPGETHTLTPDSSSNDAQSNSGATNPPGNSKAKEEDATSEPPPPLGTKKVNASAPTPASDESFTPQKGQTFLQVAAVGRDEAEAIADVLRKKNFRAHAAPKPGNTKFYRVLIGPIQSTADLSSTRDSLRKTGFRDVIVQHY